mmetsp:Transcript_82966/g.101687  ORF Transcript_82966/g.101687 Transcript_82966/m.101687 type:complete len:300 (+) Transcript_82966:64-963(+)
MSGYPGLASKQNRMNGQPMQTQPVTMQPQTVMYQAGNVQPMPMQPIQVQPMPMQPMNMHGQPIKIQPVRMTPMTDTPIQVQQEIKTHYQGLQGLDDAHEFFGDSTHIYLYKFGLCPLERLMDSITALTVVAGQIVAYIVIIAQCLSDPARLDDIEQEGPKDITYPGGAYTGMMILVTPFLFPDFYLGWLWLMPGCKCRCTFRNLLATAIIQFEVVLAGLAALLCAFYGEISSSVVATILAAVGPLLIHDIDDKIYTFWVKLEGNLPAKVFAYILFWIGLISFYVASAVTYTTTLTWEEN